MRRIRSRGRPPTSPRRGGRGCSGALARPWRCCVPSLKACRVGALSWSPCVSFSRPSRDLPVKRSLPALPVLAGHGRRSRAWSSGCTLVDVPRGTCSAWPVCHCFPRSYDPCCSSKIAHGFGTTEGAWCLVLYWVYTQRRLGKGGFGRRPVRHLLWSSKALGRGRRATGEANWGRNKLGEAGGAAEERRLRAQGGLARLKRRRGRERYRGPSSAAGPRADDETGQIIVFSGGARTAPGRDMAQGHSVSCAAMCAARRV